MFRYMALLGGFTLAYAAPGTEVGLAQTPITLTQEFFANLDGLEEVPAISSGATGRFTAELLAEDGVITYELSYSGLESAVTQAHIHFGQTSVNGGISVFLCSNLSNGPKGTQSCPQSDGEVSGTIGPDDVIGPGGQGIAPGEFNALLEAMLAKSAYANVHTVAHEAGEIRGQIALRPQEVVED